MMRALGDLEIRRLVATLLFAPLLIYSFFSAHTMPRVSDRGIEIIICTEDGAFAMAAAGDRDDPDGKRDQSPCDWAMQIHAASLPDAVPAVEPLNLTRSQTIAFAHTLLRTGKLDNGRHARAPPFSA